MENTNLFNFVFLLNLVKIAQEIRHTQLKGIRRFCGQVSIDKAEIVLQEEMINITPERKIVVFINLLQFFHLIFTFIASSFKPEYI
jgi:hypothetical protein